MCSHTHDEIGIANSVEVIRAEETTTLSEDDELVEDDNDEEGDEYGLQGRIRITTRCLWTDNGKLLESLQRAADVALAACRKDAKLPIVERQVGAVLRKVVQKYSNRRPDVIVIATDASEGVTPNRTLIQGLGQTQNNDQHQRHGKGNGNDMWTRFSSGSNVSGKLETVHNKKSIEQRVEKKKVEKLEHTVLSATVSTVVEVEALESEAPATNSQVEVTEDDGFALAPSEEVLTPEGTNFLFEYAVLFLYQFLEIFMSLTIYDRFNGNAPLIWGRMLKIFKIKT